MNRRRKLLMMMSGGKEFDPDYQSVLDYATAEGYTLPSAPQQKLQNQLVKDLKTAGVWSKLDSFANFATDGDSDFALIDWKRLITMTAANAPAFTDNQGFKGDGSSAYINTNFTPSTDGVNYALNSCSFGYYAFSVLDTGINNINIGSRTSVSPIRGLTYPRDLNETTLYINTNSTSGSTITTSSQLGIRHFSRVLSDKNEFYDDTGFVGSNTNSSNEFSQQPFYLLALNNEGTASFHTLTDMSFYFVGGDLTAEHDDFNNALKTYMGAI